MTNNPSKHISLSWDYESILLAKPFKISRGSKTHADVIVLTIIVGAHQGWAESVPYARYNESIDSTIAILQQVEKQLSHFTYSSAIELVEQCHQYINKTLTPSSAKNLLDCALWDLKSSITNTSVNALVGMPFVPQVVSAQTLSVDSLERMLIDAAGMAHLPLIKIKLDAANIVEKMTAIHTACPNSKFIIDANEAWSIDILKSVLPILVDCNVALIEQPLPANQDSDLVNFRSSIALCADESCHTSADIPELATKYQMVNVKLDKTGGLTEALHLVNAAKLANMQIMLGCMVASSLAMAPIYVLACHADCIDLDGPILVAKDRSNGFQFENGNMCKPDKFLWGDI